MPPMKLFTGPLSMFGMKAEIALAEKGLPFERVEVAYNAATGYDPKHPDVVRINPKRQVPVLIHADLELFDSTQIFEYVEDIAPAPALWPHDAKARARARQREHVADEIYFPHVVRLMGLQGNLSDPAAVSAIANARTVYADLEKAVQDQPYLCGGYTYADIAFFMAQLFGERMGATMGNETPRLIAWRDRVAGRPAVRPVMQRFAGYLRANDRPVPACIA